MKNGFTQIPNKLFISTKLSSCEKLVLCVLLMHSMGKKTSFPSRETLAEKTGFCTRTIDFSIKGLEDKHFLRVYKNKGKVNRYKIKF